MRLIVGAIGRLKAGPERELVERYAKRLRQAGRAQGFTSLNLLEFPESRAPDDGQRREDEAALLLDKLPDRSFRIAFDERGESLSSEAFAKLVSSAAENGRDVACLIGGPDGLASSLRETSDRTVAFGKLTMPHQIVRALVLEQLYRAITILAGHPYHRG